ncbi:MAG: SDR family oxidoreductase [Bryobacteraceae bacterium]
MKILVTGNMGYVGPCVTRHLSTAYRDATIVGLDTGFYAPHLLRKDGILPECEIPQQYFADVRKPPAGLLEGVDAVVHLAGISNDPIGNVYEAPTMDINYRSTAELARQARDAGVRSFVFASSCSVYGFSEDGPRTEQSEVGPISAYARSKVLAERALEPLADRNFTVTCLRFATACGVSPRLRLDLVVNDFVASALSVNRIDILSDGTPWRPLIHVHDMARAMEWAIQRSGPFLVVNVGSQEGNYQVKEIAFAVADAISGVKIAINPDAPSDRRSYKVDFRLFRSLAPDHQPIYDLPTTIAELRDALREAGFNDPNFRESQFIRLRTIRRLVEQGLLTPDLSWSLRPRTATALQ